MKEMLVSRGIQCDAQATSGPGDATALARRAVDCGCDLVVCYGGDGTINEVIQAVALGKSSLAIWAGGTSNVIARDLKLPFTARELADVIVRGNTVRVSLGLATSEGASGQKGRYFLMMAGIGLDASVARGINRNLKRRTGEFAYWVSGIKHLLSWKPEQFRIEADSRSFDSTFTVIGKGRGYGGEMVMTPGAKLTEPEFELFILPPLPNNFAYLRVLMACMRGKPERTQATIVKARKVRANSNCAPLVELDGEVIGPLPMTFEVVPNALSLVVP
jgi:YegS/Rv2252/BmrU family lipid kinase